MIAIPTVIVVAAWKASSGKPTHAPTKTTAVTHKTTYAPLLLLTPLRGSTHVAARVVNARGNVAYDGTISKGDEPVAIRGRRLWVQIDSPENLRVEVRGTLVHVPGQKPRVIVVTPTGWRPA